MEDPGLKKKCTRCEEWFDANTKNFYINRHKGTNRNSNGFLRLRNPCRKCTDAKSRANKDKKKEVDREKLNATQQAKRHAARRVVEKHKAEYDLYYAQELQKRGLQLKRYNGFQFARRENT